MIQATGRSKALERPPNGVNMKTEKRGRRQERGWPGPGGGGSPVPQRRPPPRTAFFHRKQKSGFPKFQNHQKFDVTGVEWGSGTKGRSFLRETTL